jgi:DAPG hydrolase PhiG domain
MLRFEDAHLALDPAPMPLEMGVSRLDDGTLLVASRVDMPHCSGPMFEWWFRFRPDTNQYRWWHPLDHVSSSWRNARANTHVGSIHVVQERLAGSEIHDLLIGFTDENEFFGGDHAARARRDGHVSGLVCGHIGVGHEGPYDEHGRPVGGRMCHIARDTTDGTVLRSRFWLGHDAPPDVARDAIPDEMGLQLMQHSNTEFRYLAKYLPSLYRADPQNDAALDIW